jgi:hypothetical protein
MESIINAKRDPFFYSSFSSRTTTVSCQRNFTAIVQVDSRRIRDATSALATNGLITSGAAISLNLHTRPRSSNLRARSNTLNRVPGEMSKRIQSNVRGFIAETRARLMTRIPEIVETRSPATRVKNTFQSSVNSQFN